MKNNAGFSIVEIVIAMVILAGVGAMTMSAFMNSVKTTQPGSSVAYNFGRGIMEKMYEFVRVDQMDTQGTPLSRVVAPAPGTVLVGTFQPQSSTKALNGKTYTASYTVNTDIPGVMRDTNGDGREDFRRVDMTITW